MTTNPDDISVLDLFRPLWAAKWLIVSVTGVAAVISVIVSLLLPNVYRAETLLAPNSQEQTGGVSALAAQYGGLADLAGINLSTGSPDKSAFGLEVLRSRKFIAEFIGRHDILVPLMAGSGWTKSTRVLTIDPELYDVSKSRWVREVDPGESPEPSIQEAVRRFRDSMFIVQDTTTGFVTVAIEHFSPDLAKQWVDLLVEDLNSSIRQRDVLEAEQAIEYLNKQIAATSLAELHSVFFNLIEEQTKTVMLANVSPEYLFRTIDPAVAPEEKFRPKRSLIVILSTFLGFTAAVIFVLMGGGAVVGRRAANSPRRKSR